MDTLISVSYKQFDKIRTESKKINNILYPDGILGDDFFEFAEYTEVKVGLNSSDPNAIIEIESYKDDILIHNGEEKKICCKEDNEMMLVPGCYPITIKIQNRIYQGTYKIKPSSIEWEYLLNIREYLERVVRGLSYNIYIERKNLGNLNKDKDIFILELYKFIKENYIKLINNINAIVDHPITDVYKKYDFKNYSIRQDKKSQRWLSKRGYTNNVMSMTNIYWEKHSRLNYNTSENLMVKHVINHIFNILNEAYCIYLNDKNNLEFKKKKSLNKFNDKNDKFNIIKSDPNKKKIKRNLKSELYLLNLEVEKYKNEIQIISGDLNGINKIKSFIYYYKNETWFKNIEEVRICKATMRLFRNKYYANIYNFYKELYNKDKSGRHKNIFPYKKTSELFEIYSYILIKEILEELGFKWKDGWLKDIKNILAYNGDLKSSEKIVLIKEPYKIELVYDKEIIHVRDAKKKWYKSNYIYWNISK
ncbi:hypothetical protein Z969_03910 [Clostridium novyi A str. 4570]|uniref:Uncharacterized protein n=1 Tax=Clostridium novyi A str. 4570 TaxID=1444290 RepID=A0AA88ZRC5_CLONO|nr:hypothetical protein [Clostridium novyi]KGN02643.1 hypothetical protein Z969_03910 [Clostridium novyi A str. 4570]